VAHTENPVYDTNWLEMAYSRIDEAFEKTRLFTGFSPQYPSGFWTYTIATKGTDPLIRVREDKEVEKELQYYSPQIHSSCFTLPVFLNDIIKR
ncbi:MAG TPA: spermidine synthase, partial [Thermotogota bacterium]|nr:spermidine synthase [Thermotogota bacterium]